MLARSLSGFGVSDLDDVQRFVQSLGGPTPFGRVEGEDRADRDIGDGGDVCVVRIEARPGDDVGQGDALLNTVERCHGDGLHELQAREEVGGLFGASVEGRPHHGECRNDHGPVASVVCLDKADDVAVTG